MIYTDWDMQSAGKRNMRSAIDRAAALFGERNAYEWKTENGVEAVTYAEIKTMRDALGTAMSDIGLVGTNIAICGANSMLWALAYLTVLAGAGVAVPMSADETAEGIAYMCAKSDVTLAFADSAVVDKFPENVRVISLQDDIPGLIEKGRKLVEAGSVQYTRLPLDETSTCEILFTSGTTGAKRGVMLSNKNIMSIVCCDFPYLIGLRSLSLLPFSHGFEAVCHLLAGIMPGVTICIAASPRRFAQDLVDFRVESAYVVPLQAEALLGPFAPALAGATALKTLVCGGAPLSPEVMAVFKAKGIKLMNGYGLSECSPLVTLNTIERIGSVGASADYCRIRVPFPDLSGNGEIEVTGENVMSGYYNDPIGTRLAFTLDGWLRTGDIGYIDDDGYLFITGRKKNLIVLKTGENVMPEELESKLARYLPRDAEIRVCEDDGMLLVEGYGGEDVEAFGAVLREAAQKVNAEVPTYKRIAKIKALDAPMPKTILGKIKRK